MGGKLTVTHDLKTWPNYFDAVQRGEKTFEVRRDDRGFQKGDVIRLYRFDPAKDQTWRFDAFKSEFPKLERTISYILTGGQFGIEPGFVVLGFETPGLAALSEKGRE